MKEKVTMGQITSAVGIKGELRVYPYTDIPERFEEVNTIFVEDDVHGIEKVSYRKGMVILKLNGISDRNAAELQRGKKLYISKDQLWKVPEDTYFVSDLLGCTVTDQEGKLLGVLSDVIQNSAQDLYEIETPEKKKFLVPAVKEFIVNVDVAQKTIVARLIEGLEEL